ncbi:MAG: tRNA 2-thiouridine(34) synthase MnmA [Haliangiales bacterium]
MRLYDAAGTSASLGGRCCGPRDIEDARRVCQHLGIPFYVVSFESAFQERVIDDFVDAYVAGETPNPCVKCNQHIKFTPLLQRARALGAEVLATGHYARLEPLPDGGVALRRGLDSNKDQSYFLFSMPPDELAAIRFPLGGLDKAEVRALAARYGLPNADKAESQEICFVPDGDYAGFVEARALTRKLDVPAAGDIVDRDGQVLGRHRGVHHYTLGQRRGLGNLPTTRPLYVIDIDRSRDQVVVGPRAEAGRETIAIRDVRWLCPAPTAPIRAAVQVRHRARPIEAEIEPCGDDVVVRSLEQPVIAAPGQAAVFYDRDRVLGGGWVSARQRARGDESTPQRFAASPHPLP